MFLSRLKFRYRSLYKEHFLDVWGIQLQKANFRRRTTQRFLQFYSRYVRRRFQRIRRLNRPYRQGKFKLTPASYESRPLISKFTRESQRFFLRALCRFYETAAPYSGVVLSGAAPGSSWFQSTYSQNLKFKPKLQRYYRLKRVRDYAVTESMQAYVQATYFGFSSLSGYKAFLKRHSSRMIFDKTIIGGVGAMFAYQLFRTGFFPTIRFAYNLIRAGGVTLNSFKETRPRRLLQLFDEFRLVFPFSVLILSYYISKLEMRMIWQAIPAYMDFSFRFVTFFI